MEENRKKKRKILPKRRNLFFFEKCAKENSKTKFFLPFFCQLEEQQQGE